MSRNKSQTLEERQLSSCHAIHHRSSLRHGTHKGSVSLQRERSCATYRISPQVRRMDLSSFSADLLLVVSGLSRCLFPSSAQNRPSQATSLGSFPNTSPTHIHFLRVARTMMSSCLQMLRTSKFVIFCSHLIPSIIRRYLWVKKPQLKGALSRRFCCFRSILC